MLISYWSSDVFSSDLINADAGRKTVTHIEGEGGTAFYAPVDIASPESAEAMAKAVGEHFGGIDYLVNNAALFGGMRLDPLRSEERRVGKECVRSCRSRGSRTQ